MGRARLSSTRLRTRALLLRRSDYADADLIVQLFTEEAGTISAIARGARRSARRISALEPIHLLDVDLNISPQRDLATLAEARLGRPRVVVTASLERMEAAGQALRWLRVAAPNRSTEPVLWFEINHLLDALDRPEGAAPDALLAATGLRMLSGAGWALQLNACVRCERDVPVRARVIIDVHAGGVVCRSCGGIGPEVGSKMRRGMLDALAGDDGALGNAGGGQLAASLVDRAFRAHSSGEANA